METTSKFVRAADTTLYVALCFMVSSAVAVSRRKRKKNDSDSCKIKCKISPKRLLFMKREFSPCVISFMKLE